VVDFLLVLIELFRQLSRLRRYEQILVEIVLFERGVGHFERKFQGKGGHPQTNFGVRKLDSLGYHVVCLHDTKFSRFDTIPACDTDTQTPDDGYYPRRASSARVTNSSAVADKPARRAASRQTA